MRAWANGLWIDHAKDDCAPEIQQLVEQKGFLFDNWKCDWSRVFPHWLICREEGGAALGCIQVCLGLPFGRLEFLCVRNEVPRMKKAYILALLWDAGERLLKMNGSCAYQSLAGDADGENWSKILHKRGFNTVMRGSIVMRVLN